VESRGLAGSAGSASPAVVIPAILRTALFVAFAGFVPLLAVAVS